MLKTVCYHLIQKHSTFKAQQKSHSVLPGSQNSADICLLILFFQTFCSEERVGHQFQEKLN